jgi:hypothetical protein
MEQMMECLVASIEMIGGKTDANKTKSDSSLKEMRKR